METNTRKPETEEERRERIRRAKARKELQKQRQRKKRLVRSLIYVLVAALGVLMVFAIVAIVRNVQSDRVDEAVEEVIQEEVSSSEFCDPADVLHLSFPVLSIDAAGSGLTVSQFRMILDDLYAQNYVLIEPYSLSGRSGSGTAAGRIMVPAGKKPLILSQYDVSYIAGDTAHAVGLVQDASGRINSSYYDESGTLVIGPVDVIPLVEEFIETHPDFSYRGGKGIVGLTGYRGLLGYEVEVETDPVTTVKIQRPEETEDSYETYDESYDESYDEESRFFEEEDAYASEDLSEEEDAEAKAASEKEKEELVSRNKESAEAILKALKDKGWRLASNTYAGISYAGSVELVEEDAEKWESVIEPLAGSTDILMLPQNADIGKWSGYTADNQRYTLLNKMGFRYFFFGSVEEKTWAQVRPGYVRQVMHEIPDYASYVALMSSETAGEVPAAAAGEEVAAVSEEADVVSDTAAKETDGKLDLVGSVLQPQETGEDPQAETE